MSGKEAVRGDPMLAVMWPPAWFLLLVIIPVEAYFARRIISLDWPRALRISALANLASTLVGIPLAPWVGLDGESWIVPAAAAYLCIPFFFASVLIEHRVALRRLTPLDEPFVRRWSWYANGFSYAAIFAFLAAWAFAGALSQNP